MALLEPEPGELGGRRPPDISLAEDLLDGALDPAQARGPADDLGMAKPVEEAAPGVHAFELLGPDLPDVFLAPDPAADRRDLGGSTGTHRRGRTSS